ncbi:glycerophosphodiester phosphodiesterase [Cytophaga hutchinsonii]|uniref:Glycerophosphodiester phosphodiesterase, cytosolic n=1 Tax=Cytophaga hutchinsonii (strain ATCC 33406 / DSM 1761 / CIP 103989 / NBRC 15051 / NCIMB 9469 / D465) TaxID=269798 RepID=A0A6N4SU38_CYTH3|nr:glycerophosphodiester phosphodiesterase family protein [Cytophaga hutchinsonii]ABG60002.1 glycerophosphodiester phosphodiesterase, cytosolic [Cytophaga hutchinsonii ATCC 33406]SFX25897.1 glycerophosphoryl diester phosphodiesterase [Cytophaga hutchinsonii ATCC 33406]
MKQIYLLLLCGVLFACKKKESLPEVQKIGHSGMGLYGDYPINSFESLMQAFLLGADGVEIDVQMTRDGILVLLHDELLDNQTNGTGAVQERTWDEISNLAYDNIALGRYNIIRLDFLLENCGPHIDKLFYFDIKPNAYSTEHLYTLNRNLSTLITKFNLEDNSVLMYQNNAQFLHMLSLRTDLTIYSYSDFNTAKKNILQYKLNGWVASINDIDESKVAQMHEIGARVVGFSTFNKNDHLNLIHKGVDIIQTDNLKNLINLYQ